MDHGEPNYPDCPANLRRRNTALEGELMNAKDELEGMRAALAVGEGGGNPLASKVAALEELAATKAQLNRAKVQLIAVKRNNAELEEEMDALLEIVADLKEQLDQDL
jgi:predicted DNA-binding transcriptional regulator YafY